MHFEIDFNNAHGQFTAGEVISGNVIIKNDVPIEATGLKAAILLQFKTTLTNRSSGSKTVAERTHAVMAENLNYILFKGTKNKSKVLPIGVHTFPFNFNFLSSDYPPSFETETQSYRYFLRADLDTKSGSAIIASRDMKVLILPSDKNKAAKGWQTKSMSKVQTLSRKKVSLKVAIPTLIGHTETVPIHLLIQNDSKNPRLIIRSRLIRYFRLPQEETVTDEEIMKNENVEEVDIPNGEFTHHLTVNTGVTINCPLLTQNFCIRVEAETSNGSLLKMKFPVIVGGWKRDPVRHQPPFGKTRVEDNVGEEAPSPTPSTSTSPAPSLASPTASIPSTPVPPVAVATPAMTEMVQAPPAYADVVQVPVQVQAPPRPPKPSFDSSEFYTARALYSFKAAHPSELSFEEGQTITNVHESNEKGWLVGTIDGIVGLIPGRYVEPIEEQIILKF